jgi:hypothetical protein
MFCFQSTVFKMIQCFPYQRMRSHPAMFLSLTWAMHIWGNPRWLDLNQAEERQCQVGTVNQPGLLNSIPFHVWPFVGRMWARLDKTVHRRGFAIERDRHHLEWYNGLLGKDLQFCRLDWACFIKLLILCCCKVWFLAQSHDHGAR